MTERKGTEGPWSHQGLARQGPGFPASVTGAQPCTSTVPAPGTGRNQHTETPGPRSLKYHLAL